MRRTRILKLVFLAMVAVVLSLGSVVVVDAQLNNYNCCSGAPCSCFNGEADNLIKQKSHPLRIYPGEIQPKPSLKEKNLYPPDTKSITNILPEKNPCDISGDCSKTQEKSKSQTISYKKPNYKIKNEPQAQTQSEKCTGDKIIAQTCPDEQTYKQVHCSGGELKPVGEDKCLSLDEYMNLPKSSQQQIDQAKQEQLQPTTTDLKMEPGCKDKGKTWKMNCDFGVWYENPDKTRFFQDTDGNVCIKTDKGCDPCTASSTDKACASANNQLANLNNCKKEDTACLQLQAKKSTHEEVTKLLEHEKKFTLQEGLELGSNLWSLGIEYGMWTEASNPMYQLNEFFSNSKTGLWLSGQWEKSICWQTTDFNNPNDGVAFVPGTMSVGAWVAGEYTTYSHPTVADPAKMVTTYIYRITSVVNPSGLTINSGAPNCLDMLEFRYTLDGKIIDLNLDGKTNNDIVKLKCDSGAYSLTGQNSIVRVSDKEYSRVCIKFEALYLKPAFYDNLMGGELCAPIVTAGYDYGTGCQWCPGIFTAPVGYGSFGSTSGAGYGAAQNENRPGVSNPTSTS